MFGQKYSHISSRSTSKYSKRTMLQAKQSFIQVKAISNRNRSEISISDASGNLTLGLIDRVLIK